MIVREPVFAVGAVVVVLIGDLSIYAPNLVLAAMSGIRPASSSDNA
jgi:hypothetical protein